MNLILYNGIYNQLDMIVGFVQTWDFAWKLMVIFDREHDDQWVTLFSDKPA